MSEPHHLLVGRQPFGAAFPQEVVRLIDEIPEKCGIDAARLDLSPQSLSEIDAAVDRIGRARCLDAEIFCPLLAYVCAVACRNGPGSIEMRLAYDGITWEPHIVNGNVDVEPYRTLYVQLTEHWDGSSTIYGAIDTDILFLKRAT